MEATRWDRNPKWLIEPPFVWPHLQTKLTTMKSANISSECVMPGPRCEFLDIPDVTDEQNPVDITAPSFTREND